MSKHTAGPWVLNGDQVEVESDKNDGYRVCDVFGPDYKANGLLIAAAPNLLECLKYCVDNIQGIADGDDMPSTAIRAKARAAIAKAEVFANGD